MITAALVFAGLAGLLHVYIFTMESLTWTSKRTRAAFGTTAEEAETTKLLAFNQGFYNLFHLPGDRRCATCRGTSLALNLNNLSSC